MLFVKTHRICYNLLTDIFANFVRTARISNFLNFLLHDIMSKYVIWRNCLPQALQCCLIRKSVLYFYLTKFSKIYYNRISTNIHNMFFLVNSDLEIFGNFENLTYFEVSISREKREKCLRNLSRKM